MSIFKFKCELNQQHKQLVWDYWHQASRQNPANIRKHLLRYQNQDANWFGFAPLNQLSSPEAQIDEFWLPLYKAFSHLQRLTYIFIGGISNGKADGSPDNCYWVGGTGVFKGLFQQDWQISLLRIPANQQPIQIRWAEFCRFEEARIVETYQMLDLVDFFEQIGNPILPPCKGVPGIYPAPMTQDGVLLDKQEQAVTGASQRLIRDFLFEGLNLYDQHNLNSMGVADFFHQDVKWYGPGGIGGCLSLKAFEEDHQKPWLIAFPDRKVCDLDSLFAEGNYVASSGWTGVKAKHTGSYLGYPASGKDICFNGIDFWRSKSGKYVENWVFVDMIHLFGQMGIDLLNCLNFEEGH